MCHVRVNNEHIVNQCSMFAIEINTVWYGFDDEFSLTCGVWKQRYQNENKIVSMPI